MSRRADKEEAAHLQYETEHTDPGRSKSVIPYLIILVAAAFVLLLMAWAMQMRTERSVEGLNQSVNNFQTIDQLVEDNRNLHEEVTRLTQELRAAQDQRLELERELETVQARLDEAQRELEELLGPEVSPAPLP